MKRWSRRCGGATAMPRRTPCATTSIRLPDSSVTPARPRSLKLRRASRMDDELRRQRDVAIRQLEELIRHGRQIKNTLSTDALRAWQQECAAAVNQLSGGSKAHWLARAYSEAFLVRSGNGGVVVEADTAEIVDRIVDVLAQGAASLSRMDDVAAASSGEGPRPRRFDFVHNAELRPVLERASDDSRDALDRGEFGLALILSCGIIDALLADAIGQGACGGGPGALPGFPRHGGRQRCEALLGGGLRGEAMAGCRQVNPTA